MRTEKIILPNMWSIEEGKNLLVTKVWTDKFQYAEVEVSEEQHFFFEGNGVQLRLSINDHGFTLWDNTEGQWILDASMLGYSAHLTFGKNDILKGVVIEPNKEKPDEYEIKPKVVIDAEARPTMREADVLVRCVECGALLETDVHCDNCGSFQPTRRLR